jgi:hypothetical protein
MFYKTQAQMKIILQNMADPSGLKLKIIYG